MRKWILKGTALKTPFHIALFRMKLRSDCTFFQGRISAMPEIRTDLFLAIFKTGMCLLTLYKKLNDLLVWFPAGQGLKKVDFGTFFLKFDKISYDS